MTLSYYDIDTEFDFEPKLESLESSHDLHLRAY